MADLKFTIKETNDYFSGKLLNTFIETREKRGCAAVTLFKVPYSYSELESRPGVTVGMLNVLDLMCCEVPVGYAFVIPYSVNVDISNTMINMRSKASKIKKPEPQLKFRGSNFSIYVDKRSDDIAIIIDRANLVDVSAAN